MMPRALIVAFAVVLAHLWPATAAAQVDARMFRYPDVSATSITFVYAGDIWVVAREGGTAVRLSSPRGEELFPRFSPDGSSIAFSANYDGNQDVYVVPTSGGMPRRLTHHPMADRVLGWHPDGRRVLFASGRESGRQRFNQFFLVDIDGGLPEKLPVPYGEFGDFSADGRQFAYMPISRDFRTWKRYRGGMAPDVWLFDLETFESRNLTNDAANDGQPMVRGNTVYFMSDRGRVPRNNIWAHDLSSGETRQVTSFTSFDLTFPAMGDDAIVFQAGGRLHLLDLQSEQAREVSVKVVTDAQSLRPRLHAAGDAITGGDVSPTGRRAIFEARGDLITVPAEHGAVINLTRSSGVAERYPQWSPDGTHIAYWSDRGGEYELMVRPADGPGPERQVTHLGPGFRYAPQWSPDSTRVAFADQAMRLRIVDIVSGEVTDVDQSPQWMAHGQIQGWSFNWSSDSRWVAYARPMAEYGNNAVFLYDTRSGDLRQVTSGYLNDTQPVFDPDGKYLYYTSDREFSPVYSAFDTSWTYANPTRIIAVPLRGDVPSPLMPRNDAEVVAADEPASAEPEAASPDAPAASDAPTVDIVLDGFEARGVVLPPAAGNYGGLQALAGKIVYQRRPRAGSGGQTSAIVAYDLASREEQTILDNAGGFLVTRDGKKVLVSRGGRFAVLDFKPGATFADPMATGDIQVPVDPRAEWRQMFMDAYRFQRDYFYDQDMHGVDWAEMRDHYMTLLQDAVTRWDVSFVLGELIGELDASHTYNQGGDVEQAESSSVGMLGIDWELTGGAWRVKQIVRGGPWDTDARSPLDEPGVDVGEGDFILAVNGQPLSTDADPWAGFQGLGGKTVMLTVNDTASTEGARQVAVTTLTSEVDLRFRAWIEARRQRVDEATGGRIGYIYVQSTGVGAQNELMRQFMAQWQKDGLIIDERFNSGGQIPDRFIELLNRPMLAFWAVRDGASWQWPPVAHRGAQVMLINGWSGSGGDAFPFYFREAGLGPLIGTRTWGGLIGISGAPPLVDGGAVTVPTFRMYDPAGDWFPEGLGVEPDIHVVDNPTELARGTDPQLERAIREVVERVRALPPTPARPAPDRRGGGGRGGNRLPVPR